MDLNLFCHFMYWGEVTTYELNVSEDVVLYIKKKYPNEIMLKTKYQKGKITSEVSPLTAYHLGWTDSAEELEKFKQLTR